MKTQKEFRGNDTDGMRKAKRLEPIRKSGKERHFLYGQLGHEDDDEEYTSFPRRESALDYLDTEEEE